MKWAPMLLLAGAASLAQPLRVYSEFAEINAQGEVVAPESPREILSPAMVRNGFTSFQVVIQAPKGTPFTLHVGQNPVEAVEDHFVPGVGRPAGASGASLRKRLDTSFMDGFVDRSGRPGAPRQN